MAPVEVTNMRLRTLIYWLVVWDSLLVVTFINMKHWGAIPFALALVGIPAAVFYVTLWWIGSAGRSDYDGG